MAEPGKRGYAVPIAIAVVIVVVLILVLSMNKKSKKTSPAASPGASPASSPTGGDRLLIANGDGTYSVVGTIETFSRYVRPRPRPITKPIYGRPVTKPMFTPSKPWMGRERFEGDSQSTANDPIPIRYVKTDVNIFDMRNALVRNASECGAGCKTVDFSKSEDVFWYMQKLYDDINALTQDEFKSLVPHFEDEATAWKVVNEDPLTFQTNRQSTQSDTPDSLVVGVDISLGYAYQFMLMQAKWNGDSLVAPVPGQDYSWNI